MRDLRFSSRLSGGIPAAFSCLSSLVCNGRPVISLANRLYVGYRLSRMYPAPVYQTSDPSVEVGTRSTLTRWCRGFIEALQENASHWRRGIRNWVFEMEAEICLRKVCLWAITTPSRRMVWMLASVVLVRVISKAVEVR